MKITIKAGSDGFKVPQNLSELCVTAAAAAWVDNQVKSVCKTS